MKGARVFDEAEAQRRIASMIQTGIVREVDESRFYYRVEIEPGFKTVPIPRMLVNGFEDVSHRPLRIGEQVLLMVPYGDPAQAVIVGSIPRTKSLSGRKKTVFEDEFSDGTKLSYDTASQSLKVIFKKPGTIEVDTAGGGVTIKAESVKVEATKAEVIASDSVDITGKTNITGQTTITGTLDVSGAASFSSTIAASGGLSAPSMKVDGAVSASSIEASGEIKGSDVKAGSISLLSHTHGNGNNGSPTGGPQ